LNVVCEGQGVGSAVLIRALRPLKGHPLMARRRGRRLGLCNGPGKLTQALGVDLAKDGYALTGGDLTVSGGGPPDGGIVATTRVGITRGAQLPWRYLVLGEANVSVPPKRLEGRRLRNSWKR
ncbi:MAG: DNA-3-methyladenine glycosylase, partial [Actinomycetota bacterium]|nr:DNA-3-methyladenine glycosylase [Actinomycetota bacterium]